MAAPRELSLEAIRIYMLENGGKVTNHDLVKHFKRFLTNPETRDEARNQFKEYVNTLATIRNEEGEKCLVLKKRFRPGLPVSGDFPSPCHTPSPSSPFAPPPYTPPPYTPPPPASLSPCSPRPAPSPLSVSCESLSPGRAPPPYRPPPPPAPAAPAPPTAPPRRRSSSERLSMADAGAAAAAAGEGGKRLKAMGGDAPNDGVAPASGDTALSVKERTQRFQRMASEGDLLRAAPAPAPAPGALPPLPLGLRNGKCANDDTGDAVSVSMLDTRAREWLVRAAQADHLRLTKLATEDPRLARLRDPTSTALHWAAKFGNEHIVKLIAGAHKGDVNARTGYTPAHIAMQFNRENIFSLLVEVYGADPNLRDWSGKKPRQYLTNQDTTVSADTFRSEYSSRKSASMHTPLEKHSIGPASGSRKSFLRKSSRPKGK